MTLASTSLTIRAGPDDIGTSSRREAEHQVEDVIVEILLKLPVKSLVRFKCVCKGWYNLIISPSFIAMHYSHKTRKEGSLLSLLYTLSLSDDSTPPISFQFNETTMESPVPTYAHRVKIVGCFYGVVCLCISSRSSSFALWNPATGNYREFNFMFGEYGSHIKNGLWGFACSFDAVGINFKVAQVSDRGTNNDTQEETRAQVNIFSSNANLWSEKEIDFPCRIEGTTITSSRPCCVNWNMYWLVTAQGNFTESNRRYLLSFDMRDEVYKRIDMPYHPIKDKVHLAGYRESLAMLVHRETYIDVWVMSDCTGASQSWSKLQTFRQYNVKVPLGLFSKDGVDSVAFKGTNDCLYLYNLETGEITKLWKAGRIHAIFQYNESLALLK